MKRSTLLGIAACVATLALVLVAQSGAQQDKSKRPSPPGTAKFAFADGKAITVNYSRPKVQDPQTGQTRKIYGGLVPYGEVWRAGANEATSFVTDANLNIGGTAVPPGSYTLYILPQQNAAWELIISKKTGQWGIPYPGEQFDLARVKMKVEQMNATIPQLTIGLDQRGPNAGVMRFDWENTRASVDFSEGNK